MWPAALQLMVRVQVSPQFPALEGVFAVNVLINQRIPMHDGVELAADVWLPDGPGSWPIVLVRTPYHRQGASGAGKYYTDLGYGYVVEDVRGKYDSDGRFQPLDDEAADGQDTISWVADQTWCNGRIGMTGKSYLGIVQLPAAAGGHEALRCILPGVAPNNFFTDWTRYNGCFALANMVRWPLDHDVCRTKPHSGHFTYRELWDIGARYDLAAVEARVGFHSNQLRTWVEHDRYDEYWASIDQTRLYERIACAGMHQAGFFDHISRGQFDSFKAIRDGGATEFARENQRLLVGAWGHGACEKTSYGIWDFGSAAGIDINAYELRFLDLWLRDTDDGVLDEPPVRYFLMGENRWETASDWPPPGAQMQSWYLHSDGDAVGIGSRGRLRREQAPHSHADRYTYNPADPVPTCGGQVYWGMNESYPVGPAEQRGILRRDDVLCYRSDPFAEPLTVVGNIEAELWVNSSAPDTDFIAKLCVIEPDGRIVSLCIGSIRCRYRDSYTDPQPLIPGEPVCISVQMNHLAYTFPRGSRLALLVTSSDCPRILPHPNTMAPTWRESNRQIARQEVLHGPQHTSRLLLPVIED